MKSSDPITIIGCERLAESWLWSLARARARARGQSNYQGHGNAELAAAHGTETHFSHNNAPATMFS